MLGPYQLSGGLASQSGFSVWGFGQKGGREYFIKQFLSPKYPADDKVSSPERIAKLRRKCERFEQRKRAVYARLNFNSDGNAVRIEEFFRVDTKYYISMQKINSVHMDVEQIVAMPEPERRFLCSVIAHAVAGLHKAGIVHADLKHDNVLFTRSRTGHLTAKVIDFDSGFLETDPPAEGEEIIGDQIYFSPEACMTFMGMEPELTCKMDVFALGVLFHQYYTGNLPGWDESLGGCAGEAVARGGVATVSQEMPEDIHQLLTVMLDADPHKRPSAIEVFCKLTGRSVENEVLAKPITYVRPAETPAPATVAASTTEGNPFFTPGDL
jgi:serine/threonine protein kinase